jgi:hypothetical protein
MAFYLRILYFYVFVLFFHLWIEAISGQARFSDDDCDASHEAI